MRVTEIQELLRLAEQVSLAGSSKSDLKKLLLSDSKSSQFLQAVKRTTNDKQVATIVYGNEDISNKYLFLKSYTTSLLTAIFLDQSIDQNIESKLTRGIYQTQKDYTVATLVERLGGKRSSVSLAKKTLRLAQEFQLTNVTIDILEALRHYCVITGKRADYAYYDELLLQTLAILQDEIKIRSLDHSIRINAARRMVPEDSATANVGQTIADALEIINRHPDRFDIQITGYRILYACRQLEGDVKRSLAACTDAIAYIKKQDVFFSRARIGEFSLYRLENYLLLRDYKQGIQAAEDCKSTIREGSNLWFKYKEYHFLLAMQVEQFSEAERILEHVTTHRRFEVQLDHLKERWDIFRLYAQYVRWVQATNNPKDMTTTLPLLRYKQYRDIVSRFPNYSHDKSGFNVAILILNILIHIESGRFEKIVDYIESLNSYRQRYLRNSQVNQTATLFRMLRIIVSSDFSPSEILTRTQKLEEQLFAIPINPKEITEGLQVLSPQWIWNRISVILKKESEL